MNFSFYVSGKAGRLNKVIDQNHEMLAGVKVVITDSKDALHLESELQKLNIVLQYFDYEEYKEKGTDTNLLLSNFILESLIQHDINYCFCFGDHILKGKLLEVYKNKIINFHPSILPMFPGRKAIDKALASDTTILLGNTAHFIDEGIDTGSVIMQSVVGKDYFYSHGYEGILDLQISMLYSIYNWLKSGDFSSDMNVKINSGAATTPSYYTMPITRS